MPSILDDIAVPNPTGAHRYLIHGPPGSWKTSFAAGAPSPLFIATEMGLSQEQQGTVKCVRPRSFEQVMDYLTALYKEAHQFQTVVIDTADHLYPLMHDHILKAEGVTRAADIAKRDGFGAFSELEGKAMKRIYAAFEALNTKGINCIMLAHSQSREVQDPLYDTYSRWEPKVPKRACAVMVELSDIIGFSSQKVFTKTSGEDRTLAVTPDSNFYLTLNPRPSILAKNRSRLPDGIPTTWEALQAALITHTK